MKRFTKKGGLDFTDKNLNLKEELGYSYIYNRLAELEDAIENEELLKPPCKIGAILFELDTYYSDINKWKIKEIHCSMLQQKADKSWKIRFSYRYGSCCRDMTEDDLGKTIFKDKLQAEAKLEELIRERENLK